MVSSALTDRSYRPSPNGFSLRPAADQLYEAFAAAAGSRGADRCPHCVSDADLEASALPVATIDAVTASRLLQKVGTTWGTPDDVRRLAPRLLTLAADHQLRASRSVLWAKFRWADWPAWSSTEVDAVGRFLLAEFTRLLRNPPRPAHTAHRWLAQASAGVDDLSGFLTVWHDAIGPLPDPEIRDPAVSHLVELLTHSPLRPDLPATMADVVPEAGAAAQLTRFLTGPGVDVDLRRAAADLAGSPRARRVNVAVERLRRFRGAVERGPDPSTAGR